MSMQPLYEGSAWVRRIGRELSPLGARVADMLGDWAGGIYHLQPYVAEVDWSNPQFIELRYRGDLSTFDTNNLTRLVLLAHDRMIRVSLSPKSNVTLLMRFHPRVRNGKGWERHPAIETALQAHREYWPSEEEGQG